MSDSKLEQIHTNVSEIKTNLALLINAVDRINTLIDKHDKTLYGNGNVGLTAKYQEALNAVSSIKDDFKDHTQRDRWLFGIIITLLIFILGKIFMG